MISLALAFSKAKTITQWKLTETARSKRTDFLRALTVCSLILYLAEFELVFVYKNKALSSLIIFFGAIFKS